MANDTTGSPLLTVNKLTKIFEVKASAFSTKKLPLKAVDNVTFNLYKGETLGLVGESGCGKTTVGRCLLRLYEPDGGRAFLDAEPEQVRRVIELDEKIADLKGRFDGEKKVPVGSAGRELRKLRREVAPLAKTVDIFSMSPSALKRMRQKIQIVFQDPWASLNPRMLVKDIVGEGPREFGTHKGKELNALVHDLLDRVGLPSRAAERYPHEFSGGQRQRIGIARALSVVPRIIVCDEPVSALDVSIQAQILNLLISLQEEFSLTLIFIAHDLSVVQYVADRIAVMYLGRIVEVSEFDEIINRARHPYTVSLLSAVPVADPEIHREEIILEGDVPSPINPPSGCTFHPRCPRCIDVCKVEIPPLAEHAEGHLYACHNPANP